MEGNNARYVLHKKTVEYTTIFMEFNDWMGLITRCNQALEKLRMKIQTLNEEGATTHDPLAHQENFDEIQHANNTFNALFEAQTMAKKGLRSFLPVVQNTYLQMHQVDILAYAEWNALIASKPQEFITSAMKHFLIEVSLLSRKW
jgi:hypothetical protein